MSGNHHQDDDHDQHQMTYGTQILVFLGVAMLYCVNIACAALHVPPTARAILMLSITLLQAVLVVYFFMHLKYEKPYMGLFFGVPVLVLIIIFLWTFSDYPFRVYN